MSDITNSFIQGASLVRQGQLDNERRQRQGTLDALALEQHQRQGERHNLIMEESRQRLDEFNEGAALRKETAEAVAKSQKNNATLSELELKEFQGDTEQRQKDRAIERQERDKSIARNDKAYNDQQNLSWLQSAMPKELYNLKAKGQLSPEFYRRMKGTSFDMSLFLDDGYVNRLEFLSAALDPKDSRASANDPRTLAAFNDVFANEINKGLAQSSHPESGSPAINKRIVSVRPGEQPGIYLAELEVTYQDGSTRRVPMTDGRSNDANAPISEIGLGDMIQQVNVRKAYKDQLQRSGLMQNYAAFEQHQQQQAARQAQLKNSNLDPIVPWGGKSVKRETMLAEFKSLFSPLQEGGRPPISFEEFLFTQGDANLMRMATDIANQNRQIEQHNQLADDDEQLPYLNVIEEVEKVHEQIRQQQQSDPKQAELDALLTDSPASSSNQPPIDAPAQLPVTTSPMSDEESAAAPVRHNQAPRNRRERRELARQLQAERRAKELEQRRAATQRRQTGGGTLGQAYETNGLPDTSDPLL